MKRYDSIPSNKGAKLSQIRVLFTYAKKLVKLSAKFKLSRD